MNLYKVSITTSIWRNNPEDDDYEILEYEIFEARLSKIIKDEFIQYGFSYIVRNTFLIDIDDTYPISDARFEGMTKKLRLLLRDEN